MIIGKQLSRYAENNTGSFTSYKAGKIFEFFSLAVSRQEHAYHNILIYDCTMYIRHHHVGIE